jgi:hypothetical protein
MMKYAQEGTRTLASSGDGASEIGLTFGFETGAVTRECANSEMLGEKKSCSTLATEKIMWRTSVLSTRGLNALHASEGGAKAMATARTAVN